MSIGGEILEALQDRLLTIKKSNGYGFDLKSARVNQTEPTLNVSSAELPLVEIFDDGDDYEHGAGSSYWCETRVFLYIVAEKETTDFKMQALLTDIRKAIFGGTADATGNTGVTLGGKIAGVRLIGSASDLNMIDSNRIYILKISLRSHRTTYKD